ncbi:uncharacterized protein LOC134213252 [Armigeres subalbatus]|uniref:uncharacterized protein LOC134213252 n=1 Tax=Armigeres subalbatus TaxID=124917 RepID=UPI002ED28B06
MIGAIDCWTLIFENLYKDCRQKILSNSFHSIIEGMMKNWILPGCAFMAIAINFCSCDLGLNISILGVPLSVSRAIGAGVQPVISANSTISTNETVDSSGVLTSLQSIVNDVVSPLNALLSDTVNTASDKSGDPTKLFANLDDLAKATISAIDDAQTTSADIQSVISPSTYALLNGSLEQLAVDVSALTTVQNTLVDALNNVTTADPPFTTRNITTVITASLISNYTSSLKSISTTLSTLGRVITTAAKDKQSTIMKELTLNDTIDSSLSNLIQVVTSFNRTSYGVFNSVIRASDNSLRSLNQSYTTIISKASNYNHGDMTNLTNFLTNASAIVSAATAKIESNTAAITLQLAYTLGNQTTNISTVLYNAVKNISSLATTSTSAYSSACERKYVGLFQQPGLSVSRLNSCIQSEGPGLTTFAQIAVPGLYNDVLRWVGPQVVRLNLCSVPNGNCSVVAFSAFSDLYSQLEIKYNLIRDSVLSEQNIVLYRATSCINAVSSDLQDVASSIQDRFGNCLTTGN